MNGSTWGHVKWQKACLDAGITPLFGTELLVDGAPCWMLAEDLASFYALNSLAHTQKVGASPSLTAAQWAGATGVVRFGKGGDYLSIDPGSPLRARQALASGAPLVCTSDNYYVGPQDRPLFGLTGTQQKPTPQHLQGEGELRASLGLAPAAWAACEANAQAIVARCGGQRLQSAPIIKLPGSVLLECTQGIAHRFTTSWTQVYRDRLAYELNLIESKNFGSYFIMVADMVNWAKAQGMLVGPARGSSAGSLVCYLMGITEIDPIPHGLLFERFIDVTRDDLPDIDIDFPDSKRDSIYGYLAETYGADQVARIGTVSEYKAKSALTEVAKRLNVPPWETQALRDSIFVRSSGDSRANNCLLDTLEQTEAGKNLLAKFPAIRLAADIEGHASHSGVHAGGVIVCNRPIANFCTVDAGIAQLDKDDAEKLNLLKIDVLSLRTLSVLEDVGIAPPGGFYNLPLDDSAVFDLLNSAKFAGIFQWEGQALQQVTKQITMRRFEDMSHITALARPGPMGGGAADHFVQRHNGREKVDVASPSMLPYCEETYGLVIFQEQVMRMAREIGQLSWEDTSSLRKAMSKSFGQEYFAQFEFKFTAGAAAQGITARAAKDIWQSINSMGSWAFNKSHSVAYAIVSYWTAWMKVHHPLEYAAASLRNSKDDESTFSMLRELDAEGISYVPFDPMLSEENWTVQKGKLYGGYLGIKGVGPTKAKALIAAKGKWNDSHRKILDNPTLVYGDLYPAHRLFADYYNEPEKMGLGNPCLCIDELPPDGGEVVFIARLIEKDTRDKNENVLINRRGGKVMTGPTAFLDMRMSDDTVNGFLVRIERYDYEPTGRLIAQRGRENLDWFLIRAKKAGNSINMATVIKIRCLTDPDLLKAERKNENAR